MPEYVISENLRKRIDHFKHKEFSEKIVAFNNIHRAWEELKKDVLNPEGIQDVEELMSELIGILEREEKMIGIFYDHVNEYRKADNLEVLRLDWGDQGREFDIINILVIYFGAGIFGSGSIKVNKDAKSKMKELRRLLVIYRNLSSVSRLKTLRLYSQFVR